MSDVMGREHTPGPWAAELGEAYNVRAPHGGIVSQIHHLRGRHGLAGRIDGNEAAANARLIAAAPELLEALKDTLCALEVCGKDFAYAMGKARAAIAKAEDSQP